VGLKLQIHRTISCVLGDIHTRFIINKPEVSQEIFKIKRVRPPKFKNPADIRPFSQANLQEFLVSPLFLNKF
jgi:hypothetical protein